MQMVGDLLRATKERRTLWAISLCSWTATVYLLRMIFFCNILLYGKRGSWQVLGRYGVMAAVSGTVIRPMHQRGVLSNIVPETDTAALAET